MLIKKQIIVLRGGLGNQMSQYAFYMYLKSQKDNNALALNTCLDSEHNGFELSRVFPRIKLHNKNYFPVNYLIKLLATNKYKLITAFLQKILAFLGVTCINEKYDYSFKNEYLTAKSGICFYLGGWHCEKYFTAIANNVMDMYKFDTSNLGSNCTQALDRISTTESVALHIRKGDYLTVGSKLFGNVCSENYYKNAIEKIILLIESPEFFIFSDDPEWVKNNFNLKGTYINFNKGKSAWKDMFLMSQCKHNIVCNSSFSWWGAWLNQNPTKLVICPQRFIATEITTDVYPDNWIKVES